MLRRVMFKTDFLKTWRATSEISVYASMVEDKSKCVLMCQILCAVTLIAQVSSLLGKGSHGKENVFADVLNTPCLARGR